MSLILDALNRSRGEAEPVPGLATEHMVTKLTPSWRHYLPWAALAVALLIILWLVLRGDNGDAPTADIAAPVAELSRNLSSAAASVTTELKSRADTGRQSQSPAEPPTAGKPQATPPPAATAAPAAALAEVAPAAEEAPAAAKAPAAEQAPTAENVPAAGQEPVAKMESAAEPDSAAAAPTADEPQGEAAVGFGSQPPPDPAVASLYQRRSPESEAQPQTAPAATRPQEQEVDLEAMLRQAQEEVENASLEEHPAPFLVDLSQRTKDEIPTLLYQRHEYSDNRASSAVVINGKTLRIGQSPAPGVKLDAILPGSAVFSFKGTQFRLRALNSWVNL